MERGVFILRNLLHLAVEFRGRSLIDTAGFSETTLAYSLKDTQHACCINVGSKLRSIKRNLHMALCGKVVDFVWFYFPNHLQNAHRIAEVSVMEVEVRMPFQVGDTLAVIG